MTRVLDTTLLLSSSFSLPNSSLFVHTYGHAPCFKQDNLVAYQPIYRGAMVVPGKHIYIADHLGAGASHGLHSQRSDLCERWQPTKLLRVRVGASRLVLLRQLGQYSSGALALLQNVDRLLPELTADALAFKRPSDFLDVMRNPSARIIGCINAGVSMSTRHIKRANVRSSLSLPWRTWISRVQCLCKMHLYVTLLEFPAMCAQLEVS